MSREEQVLEELEVAAAALKRSLDDLIGAIAEVRRERANGRRFSDVYRECNLRDVRDAVYERVTTFERAFNAARSIGVRAMVDEDGLTLTQVSQLMRRSRQFVTRLYRNYS